MFKVGDIVRIRSGSLHNWPHLRDKNLVVLKVEPRKYYSDQIVISVATGKHGEVETWDPYWLELVQASRKIKLISVKRVK